MKNSVKNSVKNHVKNGVVRRALLSLWCVELPGRASLAAAGCICVAFAAMSCSAREDPAVRDTLSARDTTSTRDTVPSSGSSLPSAPWSNAAVRQPDIPVVYYTQWSVAENRATCGLVALTEFGVGAPAVPRAATFSGGWAVAYDLPRLRSAFGIAGSGSSATDSTYSGWKNHLRWSDGSRADYGPEGGSGPNQLAYLRIAGEGCLSNVWSRIGKEHLELLIGGIRRVMVESNR